MVRDPVRDFSIVKASNNVDLRNDNAATKLFPAGNSLIITDSNNMFKLKKLKKKNSNFLTEVKSLRTSLASRTNLEVLGLKTQVLGLGLKPYNFSKIFCSPLEDSITFDWLKRKIPKQKII